MTSQTFRQQQQSRASLAATSGCCNAFSPRSTASSIPKSCVKSPRISSKPPPQPWLLERPISEQELVPFTVQSHTRLFFVFADRHDHPQRKRLDANAFILEPEIAPWSRASRIHPRYRVMVPDEFIPDGACCLRGKTQTSVDTLLQDDP